MVVLGPSRVWWRWQASAGYGSIMAGRALIVSAGSSLHALMWHKGAALIFPHDLGEGDTDGWENTAWTCNSVDEDGYRGGPAGKQSTWGVIRSRGKRWHYNMIKGLQYWWIWQIWGQLLAYRSQMDKVEGHTLCGEVSHKGEKRRIAQKEAVWWQCDTAT